MKKLILFFVSILIFSFIFFTACGESSNPTGPRPIEKIDKLTVTKLKVDIGYYIDKTKHDSEALIVGTNLGKTRGKYYIFAHWENAMDDYKNIYCNDPDLKITVQDPSILKFNGCDVVGLKTGATKVIFEYPKKGNIEGFKLEYDAWCIKHSVEGEWDLYHSNDSLSWSFYKTTHLYDVPERKITMA